MPGSVCDGISRDWLLHQCIWWRESVITSVMSPEGIIHTAMGWSDEKAEEQWICHLVLSKDIHSLPRALELPDLRLLELDWYLYHWLPSLSDLRLLKLDPSLTPYLHELIPHNLLSLSCVYIWVCACVPMYIVLLLFFVSFIYWG